MLIASRTWLNNDARRYDDDNNEGALATINRSGGSATLTNGMPDSVGVIAQFVFVPNMSHTAWASRLRGRCRQSASAAFALLAEPLWRLST